MAAPFFWMRSVSCRWPCNRNCCAPCRKARWCAWAGSAASSGVSVASSVVSSVLKGAPDAAPGKAVAAEAVEKTSSKWWWIPVGIALAALLAGLMRMLTRRKPEPVKVAVDRAPEVKTTRVVKDPAPKGRITDERDKLND